MTDDTYEDDVDEDLDDTEEPPMRRPMAITSVAVIYGMFGLFGALIAVTSLGLGRTDFAVGILAASYTLACWTATVALWRRKRYGSYLAFGLALIMALMSLTSIGLLLWGVGWLIVVMACLSTRPAKDWLGFA